MKRSGMALAFLALGTALAAAQGGGAAHGITLQVSGVSALALSDSGPIHLTLWLPAEAGAPPASGVDGSKRLWYSSLAAAGQTRRIQVHLEGPVPAGAELWVEAGEVPSGAGRAVPGGVALAAHPQDLITGIPAVFTGRGPGSGPQLLYRLQAAEPSRLRIGETTRAVVVYTITEG